MRRTHIIAALLATTIIAVAASVAGANILSSSESEFDVKWDLEGLRYALPFGSGITCFVTLLGRFHRRTIQKVEHALIGIIDHVRLGVRAPDNTETCEGGSLTVLTVDLPWHVTYEGFGVSLPTISEVELLLLDAAVFRIANDVAACLARTDAQDPARGIVSIDPVTGQADTLTADETALIDMNGLFCNSFDIFFEGVGLIENRRGGLLFIDLI